MYPRRDEYDLLVGGVVAGDVFNDFLSARLTAEGRRPVAFVSHLTFDRDEVELFHRVVCRTQICLAMRPHGYNHRRAQLDN